MGLIARIFGGGGVSAIGKTVTDVAEVFTPNATKRMELGHEAFVASVTQHGTEFANSGSLFFGQVNQWLEPPSSSTFSLRNFGFVCLCDDRSD